MGVVELWRFLVIDLEEAISMEEIPGLVGIVRLVTQR
jgi:hypothetical protein